MTTWKTGTGKRSVQASCAWLALLLSLLSFALPARADDAQDRRSQVGVKLFRALLSADLDLDRKTVDGGKLLVVFYCRTDCRPAARLAATLIGEPGHTAPTIHGYPLEIATTTDPTFAVFAGRVPAGIFLAQSPDDEALGEIIHYGIEHHVIVYTPFEGQVELGVLAGLSIEAQVRPYLNLSTLEASGVRLKPFFMKVTKVYP